MMEDPIIDEIHEVRRRIFEECGGDLERYFERLKAAEAMNKDRLVTLEDVQRRADSSKATP